MRDTFSSLALIARVSWQLDRRAAVVAMLESVGRVLDCLTPAVIGLMVTGVATGRLTPLLVGAIGLAAAQGLAFVLTVVGVQARLRLLDLVTHEFRRRIGRLSGSSPTLDHLQDPRYQDQMQALREGMQSLGMAYNNVVNVVNNLAVPATTLTIAALADLRLLILVAAAVPATWASRFPMRWQERAEEESAAPGRLSGHLTELTTAPTPASELRVFGARSLVHRLLVGQVRAWRRPHTRAQARSSALELALSVGYLLVAAVILIWLTLDAVHGDLSPGRLAVAVLVTGDLRDGVEAGTWALTTLARTVRSVGRYRWLERYVTEVRAEHDGSTPPPERLDDGIRLSGVSFAYPGAERDVLHDLDLHLPAGATIAVVGENGAGKSTLVGLLTGMHDVRDGHITVDGTDLRDLDLEQWRSRCSGAFQDHAQLELTVREAIRVGDLDGPDDDATIHTALEKASATDLLTALPDGLDTQLGTSWPDGVGLSGGQWQRVAIARGMTRRAPLLLVLDEPTSALDAATEHALFDRYAEAARRTNRNGGITLLVTHRFSTATAADLVLVIANGRVAEYGTHEELLAADGHYAELYELQAKGYR